MSGNLYLNVGPTVSGHTLTFDDSGELAVDGDSVATEVGVNSEAPVSGLASIVVTQQPLVPASGIIQPLPPPFSLAFPGTSSIFGVGSGGMSDICAGPDGNVWVTDTVVPGVFTVTPDGTSAEATNFGEGAVPQGICVGPDGNVWVTIFGSDDFQISRIVPGGSTSVFALAGIPQLGAICAGPDGNLWAVEIAGAVWKIETNGTGTRFAAPATGEFGSIRSICAGPDGNLWITTNSGGVVSIDPATGDVVVTVGDLGITPLGLCVGPDGNIWVAGGNVLKVISVGGSVLRSITLGGANLFNVCAGPDGNMWATDFDAGIWSVHTSGLDPQFFAATASLASVCIGWDGSIWLASVESSTVQTFPFTIQSPSLTPTAIDVGTVSLTLSNVTQADAYIGIEMAPYSTDQIPANLVSHAPQSAESWLPLNVVAAADVIQVSLSSTLIEDLFDEVDISGQVLVWDLTGENFIVATVRATGVVNGSSINPMGLTQVQLIGSDLSINEGGDSIISAAGGVYNVQIRALATWD